MIQRMLIFVLLAGASLSLPAIAQDDSTDDQQEVVFQARLDGYNEVPAISTRGSGEFEARVDMQTGAISYTLNYRNLQTTVQQAHVHFGGPGMNGGISVWLCSNIANAAPGKPACPQSPGSVTGTIQPSDVVGPQGQGIAPGELGKLLAAMDARATYVNVYSLARPEGEIRGQVLQQSAGQELEGEDSDAAEARFIIRIRDRLSSHQGFQKHLSSP